MLGLIASLLRLVSLVRIDMYRKLILQLIAYKRIYHFRLTFSLSIICLYECYITMLLKKIKIYIVFVILLMSLKKKIVCMQNFYNYSFNQNFIFFERKKEDFIKIIVRSLCALVQLK